MAGLARLNLERLDFIFVKRIRETVADHNHSKREGFAQE